MDNLPLVEIKLPKKFTFVSHGDYNFNSVLRLFDWSIENAFVRIDLRRCSYANYQAFSLLVLYIWHLRRRGCIVHIVRATYRGYRESGASKMWRLMGANGLFHVLNSPTDNF